MRTIRKFPAIDGQIGWLATVPFKRPMQVRRVETRAHYDYLIIGAGFSGFATAGRLAELFPDARIALLDALEVGQGTSGRNAGFIIDLPHNVDSDKPESAVDKQIRDLNCFAISRLRQISQQSGLDVQWRDAGKYMAASEEKHFANLDNFTKILEALDERYEMLKGKELASRLGTSYYKRAVYTPGNILMNPAALSLALAYQLPANVSLFENSPIRGVDLDKKIVMLGPAELSAENLILTTSSFTEEFGVCNNRLAPIFTYASLTRTLTPDEMAIFGDIEPWGLTSANPAGTTARLTPDNRILIRNRFDFLPELVSSEKTINKAKQKHVDSLNARFPHLKGVPFEFTWGGLLCMTMNHESVFKQHQPGVYVLAAMNGVGVAKGTYLGNYMAEFIAGKKSPELEFILSHSSPGWVPPDPFRSAAARIRLSFEERLAKGEI